MFENFWGNRPIVEAIQRMIAGERIPQTLLFAGPEGLGKATLVRRMAAALLGRPERIEQDDLSLPDNQARLTEREKLPADKRNEEPLVFASHPDFLTFPPDGPLRQISIAQVRWLKQQASLAPSRGTRRVFLVDQVDRANEQAANSLLKVLEEPPPYLIIVMTAQNAFDLLRTIRSRAVPFHFTSLPDADMRAFLAARGLDHPERRLALAAGCPGAAVSMDFEVYDARRAAMLALVETAAGAAPLDAWLKHSESIGRSKNEKLEALLQILYLLLRDILCLREGAGPVRNRDIEPRLAALAARVSFDWLRHAARQTDELVQLTRRNIQKTIALDALIVSLRGR
ncbi:MAG: DNA polymerase III subunit delta' [Bryobacterales bacterium]|jgi:DNA polymerase III subunit delta'|nr:DNA polymerase III subunit delta' [Bryobacterales bacterium]